MLQLARGVGASVRGDALKTQSHLNPSAHAEKPKAVVSPNAKGSVFRAVSSDSFTRQDVGSGEEEHTLREEINGLNNYRLQNAATRCCSCPSTNCWSCSSRCSGRPIASPPSTGRPRSPSPQPHRINPKTLSEGTRGTSFSNGRHVSISSTEPTQNRLRAKCQMIHAAPPTTG